VEYYGRSAELTSKPQGQAVNIVQNYVFVLDTNKTPQAPIHPAAARKLLGDGKAAVWKTFPFTLILKVAVKVEPPPVTLKVDPGSKTTGIVLTRGETVIFAAELMHRGQAIKDALESRRAIRRGRRNRKTRYRQPRFDNRARRAPGSKGWLPPSVKSRVDNLQTWLVRFVKLCNVRAISMELVKFDTQLMQDAEVSGVAYQQGELQGYEVREYLLEKFGRQCAYCGKRDTPLQVEHIMPKVRGGSDRVSNLTLACEPCNQAKGTQTAAEFGRAPAGREVQAQAKTPLKDAAAVNAARWATFEMFKASGLDVEVGTGAPRGHPTKFNRTRQGYPKAHWIDAACVGASGETVKLDADAKPLRIKATGRGSRQVVNSDKYGFPRGNAKSAKRVYGFQTGDLVKAIVPTGKKQGTHVGRVAVRAKASFRVGSVDGISYRFCKLLQRSDGYDYAYPDRNGRLSIAP
jgi:5-methylcytosine-specific restriction endonuclease McrA